MGGQGLSKGKSKVSASQGKVFLVLAVIVGFMLLIFSVLSDDEKKGPPDNTSVKREVARREVAPPPPPIDDITPPVPPISIAPPQPDTAPPPLPQVELFSEEDPNDEVRQERLRSGMVAYGGKLGGLGAAEQKAEDQDNADRALAGTDPNLAFQRNSIGNSTAPTVKATSIKGLHHTIAQGKLIHAVMETAVNTQLPGSVRAVVSRDIYAEAGYNVLIPKGSRLVGVYNTNLFQGQDRVFIIWNRVITPDGVDVMINSPATDNLGRAGVEGYLDSRYGQLFSAAILSSVLSIGVAVAAEEISGEDGGARQSQSVAPDGTFTSTGGSSTQAGADAAARIGSVGTRIMERTLDLRPRVTIDQGTPIKIMVNRDLIFPPNLASGANFIR